MTWALIGIGCLLVAGLIWLVVKLAQRATKAESERNIAEHNADVQKRMAEADARKPATGDALVERLRKAGL